MASHTLKKLKYDSTDVQVESAIRDGSGNTITSTYAKKLEAYPVGSVYISKENTSPASLMGGTWTSYGAVYFLTATTANVLTGSRHAGNATQLNFDYISGSSTIQCNQQSKNFALASDGTGLTISQLDGSSWGSNWGGWGTIIPNNLYAALSTSTVYMWKRTA